MNFGDNFNLDALKNMDMDKVMEQAKQLQDKMAQLQNELENSTVVGFAGGTKVAVNMNCRYQVQRVTIDPTLLNSDSEAQAVLEDLIAAAFNDAVNKVEDGNKGRLFNLMGGPDLQKMIDQQQDS